MVTSIGMQRRCLITNEKRDDYCAGKQSEVESVTDDLEYLLQDIRLNQQPDDSVWTYFLPKLTEEEMELVKRKDDDYLKIFTYHKLADVREADMKMSESDSKFCYTYCFRKTFW